MDRFLRNVAEKRDREQLMDDDRRMAELDALAKMRRCRVCDKQCSFSNVAAERGRAPLTVCTACGGRKMQVRLEHEDARRRQHTQDTNRLLQLAGVTTEEQAVADDEAKTCPTCGKTLRSNNTRGFCSACIASGKGKGRSTGGGLSRARESLREEEVPRPGRRPRARPARPRRALHAGLD